MHNQNHAHVLQVVMEVLENACLSISAAMTMRASMEYEDQVPNVHNEDRMMLSGSWRTTMICQWKDQQ